MVLLTLGTLISDELTDEQAENIASSLALLPQKVIWGYGGQPPRALGNNTKLVKWIPQNDLLGKFSGDPTSQWFSFCSPQDKSLVS